MVRTRVYLGLILKFKSKLSRRKNTKILLLVTQTRERGCDVIQADSLINSMIHKYIYIYRRSL